MTPGPMDGVVIDEPVAVGAVFRGGTVAPKWFLWRNRKYLVKETTFTWRDARGATVFLHCAVSDGTTVYELTLDTNALCWRLARTAGTEGAG